MATKAQVLLIPVMACFLNEGKHYRSKSQDVIYPLTLGDLQTSGQDPFLGLERGRMVQSETVKAFPPLKVLGPLTAWGMFSTPGLDRRGQVYSEVTNRLMVAVHPIGALWGGAPAESAEQGRMFSRGHRAPCLTSPADLAMPQGPSGAQPPWSCVGAARLQAQLEKKDKETTT